MGFMFPVLSSVMSAAGTIIGAAAQMQAAKGQRAMAEYQAKVDEKAAQESRASAQRTALDKRREGDLVGARLRARAAASGGSATDPTPIALGETIAGQGEYAAAMATYQGENRARALLDQAAGRRYAGDLEVANAQNKAVASMFSAAGTAFTGLAKFG